MAKRLFDLLGALIGLALLSPLLLLVALAIRLDSGGPVFFRQERVGRGGRPFRIHKFRTMTASAAVSGGLLTVGADPRITRVGVWLRGRRLDELPQLIDVLCGDMSLVGPRPEVPRYVAHYSAEMRSRVLRVRPGITDPAALAFRDEATLLERAADPEREYIVNILPRKLALQAAYAESATLATDLAVIARSLRVLVGH
jgi:lipopolysaccharide/colanic/teichoic acid biosynthesis glycosyltransferase